MTSIAVDEPGFRPIEEIGSANQVAANTILQLGQILQIPKKIP
jgi:hypothetical protein